MLVIRLFNTDILYIKHRHFPIYIAHSHLESLDLRGTLNTYQYIMVLLACSPITIYPHAPTLSTKTHTFGSINTIDPPEIYCMPLAPVAFRFPIFGAPRLFLPSFLALLWSIRYFLRLPWFPRSCVASAPRLHFSLLSPDCGLGIFGRGDDRCFPVPSLWGQGRGLVLKLTELPRSGAW